jgi:TPR repeat protein
MRIVTLVASVLVLLYFTPARSQNTGPTAAQLEIGCAAKNAQSCTQLGVILNQGTPNIPRDEKRAIAYFTIGCDLNFGPACRFLGEAHVRGIAIAFNPPEAVRMESKACDLNAKQGCYLAGNYTEELLSGYEARPTIQKYYNKGCTLGSAESCLRLAVLIDYNPPENGYGDTLSYLEKACALKDSKACGLMDTAQKMTCSISYIALSRLGRMHDYSYENEGMGKTDRDTILLYLSRGQKLIGVTAAEGSHSIGDTIALNTLSYIDKIAAGDAVVNSVMKATVKDCDAQFFAK